MGRTRTKLTGLAAAAALAATSGLAVAVTAAAPAHASTEGFRGVNWADQRDNFVNNTLVLGGLSTSDSYSTTVAKTNAVLAGFENNLGANTIRIPVNYPTVSGSYWSSYRGVIDAAGARGFRVIVSYWEADSSRDGRVDNLTQFWSMWQTIVSAYGSSSHVYFEPMNEPHGYTDNEWKNVAAEWLSRYSSVPKGRVMISGAGYNERLLTVLTDSRFNGTLVSAHIYGFWNESQYSEAAWRADLRNSIGSYASRVLITEWGAPMTTGLDYNQPSSNNAHVSFIRGIAAEARALGIGTVYWPGIRVNDSYRLQQLNGSGTNLTLTTTNASGRDQLRHSWGLGGTGGGDGGASGSFQRVTNRHSGLCLDVAGQSSSNGANVAQWGCGNGQNQQWRFEDAGSGYVRIVARHSGLCLDVDGWSTSNGGNVQQWTCSGGNNQQWQVQNAGSGYVRIVNRHSGLCLDVDGWSTSNGGNVQQWTCSGGNNQQWQRANV